MNRNRFFLLLIISIGAFLRFYNLNWGNGFYFHPDENNMARAISQLCVSKSNITEALTDAASGTVFLGHGASRPGTQKKWTPLAASVKRSQQPCSLNPHFFAYGQFPLYLAYFSSLIFKLLQNIILEPRTLNLELTVSFQDAVMLLRLISALASTLTIPVVYLITSALIQNSKLFENCKLKIVNLAAILAALTPGLIQAAHFGTTESLLTFFFMLIVYLSLKSLSSNVKAQSLNQAQSSKLKNNKRSLFGFWHLDFSIWILALGVVSGLALATKLTAIYFLPVPILAILISRYKKNYLLPVTCYVLRVTKYLLLTLLVFIIFSPYNILDFDNFLSSLNYETAVATGSLQVFYTRQFINTFPFLFQFTKIFPFSLGLPILIFGILGFLSMIYSLLTNIKKNYQLPVTCYVLLIIAFLVYLIPNAMIFTKWTRFMTPILPFFAIFSAYLLYILTNKKTSISRGFLGVARNKFFRNLNVPNTRIKRVQFLTNFVKSLNSRARVQAALPDGGIGTVFRAPGSLKSGRRMPLAGKSCWQIMNACLVILSIFPGVLFFRIYTRPDTRILASRWIYENIPAKSYILSETGNVINLPVEAQSYNVVNFDFYNLDENPKLQQDLLNNLVKADYIIIPSRRIYANLPADNTGRPLYPITSAYYSALFSGRLGFKLTHKELIVNCQLLNVKCFLSDKEAEETFAVFDHPTILIYKKTREYDKKHYEDILL